MKPEILDDIKKVAGRLGLKSGEVFSQRNYLANGGHFSAYQISDGGNTWSDYCKKDGFRPDIKDRVSDEEYWERYQQAITRLGRFPKQSEHKMFGLNVPNNRRAILSEFRGRAISLGLISSPRFGNEECDEVNRYDESNEAKEKVQEVVDKPFRPIPPIPERTKRKKWERTGVEGYPYAPQDEDGVIALFAILCAKGIIPCQITELNRGKGIDATCYDEMHHKELKVELKHTLSRSSWNYSVDSLDYVVCWENRWRDFPKPVYDLRAW